VAVTQYTFTHTHTHTIHRTTQNKQYIEQHKNKNNTKILEKCGPCPVFAGFTLAFALQLRKKIQENLRSGYPKSASLYELKGVNVFCL